MRDTRTPGHSSPFLSLSLVSPTQAGQLSLLGHEWCWRDALAHPLAVASRASFFLAILYFRLHGVRSQSFSGLRLIKFPVPRLSDGLSIGIRNLELIP